MANNHQGNVEHGLRIIREFKEVSKNFDFNFAFKLQYRNLDTFIHPEFKNNKDFKFVKRFSDTRLKEEEFKILRDELDRLNFISICTPFDEESVDLIEKHKYHIIKIGSCSFNDWPLLERIVKTDKPVIASTAGIELEDIDRVVNFFKNRNREISLMHCVAEYPTKPGNLQLNQIDLFKNRYKDIKVGYSTHEEPTDYTSIKIAIAKGAVIFEKHIGINTDEITLNAYSATPAQVYEWLNSAKEAFHMCGIKDERYKFTEKEINDLKALRRGIFARKDIKKGELIGTDNIFYAIPSIPGQIQANDASKYKYYYASTDIETNKPVMEKDVSTNDTREIVHSYISEVIELLKKSKTVVPYNTKSELSHHYGIERFIEYGATIIDCINREYCKKIIVLLPGQKHPGHFHKLKEETFNVIYGDLSIDLGGNIKTYGRGDMILVERNMPHSFTTDKGVVFEEISTTHYLDDSFYDDVKIMENRDRKTEVYLTKDIL
ncbi:MAG TPA: N-acetylneuraminate synthase family protein [Candidatus Eremiobacteraeota bacterium]|nr:N-acetylneuraminate synthase family protein [Candidatus Eremiobacteraeota bacterium]